MPMSKDAVAASAPGKVLLAGGYLVLDRAYTGLVFALDARIHVTVQDIPTRNGVVLNEVVVQSPQFNDAVWEYGYRLSDRQGGIIVTPLRADADLNLNRNPFIETALGYALTYIASVSSPMIGPSSVTILADNDYYSTPSDLKKGHAASPRFRTFGVPITKAHKTGLGSSAALVTSFTAAVLSYYLPRDVFDLSSEPSIRRLHNLAQAAHCAAQGKVGSGFDVASAVYGSCLYRRFSPSILSNHVAPGMPDFAGQLKGVVEEAQGARKWDTEIHKDAVKVPKGLRLVMCDVSVGSQTPGMVKQVLAWRKDKPDEANPLWNELHQANESFAAELKAVAEGGTNATYDQLKERITDIRRHIRLMSEKSGVPIEPPSQTKLVNACQDVPGVIGGVVPGAGGYDAISLLIEDKDQTVAELEALLASWIFEGEGAGTEAQGQVSMLGVREEMEGVRKEDPKSYDAWSI